MKLKILLILSVVMLSLTGCSRELPSAKDVKNYMNSRFDGGYELRFINKEIDKKGYQISIYEARLRKIYNIRFNVICSSKEELFNLIGIKDTFEYELRKDYVRENHLDYGIKEDRDYVYSINIEKDISKYENIRYLIMYMMKYESDYINYKKRFYADHLLFNRSRNAISSKVKFTINNRVILRLHEFYNISYIEAKRKYNFIYKNLENEDISNESKNKDNDIDINFNKHIFEWLWDK